MLGNAARYESEIKSERVSAKRRQAAQAGTFSGGRRPFGFESDGVTLRGSEAALIRLATTAILNGSSVRSIVRDWNERGITTTAGNAWGSKNLREMLVRPRNSGRIKYRPTVRNADGSIVPNKSADAYGDAVWDAIVPEDQRLAVAAIFNDPKRKQPAGNTPKWLGSGIFYCGICGTQTIVCGTAGGGRDNRPRKRKYQCRAAEQSGAVNATLSATLIRPTSW